MLIFSMVSSHCWRSCSSITMGKHITEQLEEHHKTLIRVRDEEVNAVPTHLKFPQKLPQCKAEEIAATFPGQWAEHWHIYTGIAFNLYHGLQQTAGEMYNHCPMVQQLLFQLHIKCLSGACLSQVGQEKGKWLQKTKTQTPVINDVQTPELY